VDAEYRWLPPQSIDTTVSVSVGDILAPMAARNAEDYAKALDLFLGIRGPVHMCLAITNGLWNKVHPDAPIGTTEEIEFK
jgi:hypothetical protein